MKKYLFAALALTALVACSKDPIDEVLTSSQKSVTISITNLVSSTRATGGITTGIPDDTTPCASLDENFHILFLDVNNIIRAVYSGTQITSRAEDGQPNKYIFHALQDVTHVAAVGNLTDAPEVGQDLDELTPTWKTETVNTIANEYTSIIAFAEPTQLTHDGEATYTEGGTTYPLYTASIEVKPIMARIEITQISCTDFGAINVGYDAIGVQNMSLAAGTPVAGYTLAGSEYTIALGTELDSDAEVTDGDTEDWVLKHAAEKLTAANGIEWNATGGKVWSWNIAPQTAGNLTTSLYVSGNNYTTIDPTRTVTIIEYNTTSSAITDFEAGNIYRFPINFSYLNLDAGDNIISANVTVTAANWVVVDDITPGFQTNPIP